MRWFAGGCALVLATLTAPTAQTPGPPARPLTPLELAAKAINEGRYDEVAAILQADGSAASAALRARAAIERGRYPEAEALLKAPAASAPGSDAALELGRLLLMLGRRDEGRPLLRRIVDGASPRTASEYARMAAAARALGQYKDANDFYRNATRLAPDSAAINTAWGELFLEKYDRAEAAKSFQAALKADASYVPAHLGIAAVAAAGNPPAAKEAIDAALKINPSSVTARVTLGDMALDDRRRDDARAEVDKALAVNPKSLEALSLRAAVDYIEGKQAEFDTHAKEILAINPRYGTVYRVAGDHAARNYLFDEAVVLTRRALAIDETDATARANLGMHLLRTGDEAEARRALERAFKDDPFNISTFNSLDLLDRLDKFAVVEDGDLIFKFHQDEVAVMRDQAIPLAKEALAALSKRYGFMPKGPLLIEMFPRHDDFAVRTVGLPGMVGALGACFGRVVTLDSPKARKPGDFHWGETLWHELAHVMTLQMSNNRVPRWVTEGASVWEERRAGRDWGRESDFQFLQALQAGKTLKLETLNDGFSDPKTIGLAYYQASLVIEHIVDTYGEPAYHRLLRAYGQGLEEEVALKDALGVNWAQLQAGFDARIAKDYAADLAALKAPELKEKLPLEDLKKLASENPGSAMVQMALGQALQAAGDLDGAMAAYERAATLLPRAGGGGNPQAAIARLALQRKDTDRAMRALESVVRLDPSDVEAARQLAGLVAARGNDAATEAAYRRVVDVDPFDAMAQTQVGQFAMKRKDAALALRSFRTAIAAGPSDRAAAHTDLGEALLASGNAAEAKRHTLEALEIAPSFERAQDLLLKLAAP
jgi:tetratricopeptide (TPR) repeat protein